MQTSCFPLAPRQHTGAFFHRIADVLLEDLHLEFGGHAADVAILVGFVVALR